MVEQAISDAKYNATANGGSHLQADFALFGLAFVYPAGFALGNVTMTTVHKHLLFKKTSLNSPIAPDRLSPLI